MNHWALLFRQLDVMTKQFEQSNTLTMDDIVLLNLFLAARDAFNAGKIKKFVEMES
jgi:hypothetical protein